MSLEAIKQTDGRKRHCMYTSSYLPNGNVPSFPPKHSFNTHVNEEALKMVFTFVGVGQALQLNTLPLLDKGITFGQLFH